MRQEILTGVEGRRRARPAEDASSYDPICRRIWTQRHLLSVIALLALKAGAAHITADATLRPSRLKQR